MELCLNQAQWRPHSRKSLHIYRKKKTNKKKDNGRVGKRERRGRELRKEGKKEEREFGLYIPLFYPPTRARLTIVFPTVLYNAVGKLT